MLLSVLFILGAVICDPEYVGKFTTATYGYTGEYVLQSGNGPYGSDASRLRADVYLETKNRLHIKIWNPDRSYHVIPEVIQDERIVNPAIDTDYEVSFSDKGAIIVKRKLNGEVIFDMSGNDAPMVVEQQFIQFSTKVAEEPYVYGLDQRRTRFALGYPFKYSFSNQDRGTTADGKNLYGYHPVAYEVRDGGLCHGLFYFNSAPMEVELVKGRMTYRSMEGWIDVYIFLGPTMGDVSSQYTELVGRPCLVPHWAMGFHNCRYGYLTIQAQRDVVQKYSDMRIPMDVEWFDIDYMNEYRLWTVDYNRFPKNEMVDFLNGLREKGQRSVAICDPGVKIDTGYEPYNDLIRTGAYIKAPNGAPFLGRVWPGDVVFPDFTHEGAEDYWKRWFKSFLTEIPLDGVWNDMNEIASFCQGYCDGSQGSNPNFPWVPEEMNVNRGLPANAVTKGGSYLVTKAFYAHLENLATVNALKELRPGKRPFVLTRSSFSGSGRFSTRWLGDNRSFFADLRDSISGVLTSGLVGMPFTGCDVGGFMNNSYGELQTRWVQLGAFLYPFFRSHCELNTIPQELYIFGEPYTSINRKYVETRQKITSYLYTLMHAAHRTGLPITRPLMMEFTEDKETYKNDLQAMVGSSILVTPVLDEGRNTVEGYFPRARWYDFYTLKEDQRVTGGGKRVVLDASLDTIPVHIRGGTIHTQQEKIGATTSAMWDEPLTVIAALDDEGYAYGEVVVDDHEIDSDTAQVRTTFTCSGNRLLSNIEEMNARSERKIGKVIITGLKNAQISNINVASTMAPRYTYTYSDGVLSIEFDVNGMYLIDEFVITWM